MSYSYEGSWRPYAFSPDINRLSNNEEIKTRYPTVDLTSPNPINEAGLPLICDGKRAVLNSKNENTIIYGATRSGKTRCLLSPLICMLAQAGESMVITDPKGELSQGSLSQYVIPVLRARGYNIRIWDIRTFDHDSFSFLDMPYLLYKGGFLDEASAEISSICSGLSAPYRGDNTRADPFWVMVAEPGLAALIHLVFELCDSTRQINFLTIAQYTTEEAIPYLQRILEVLQDRESNVLTTIKNILSQPEKTRMSTMATIHSFLAPFLSNDAFLRMCSHSTIELQELIDTPTALFLVVPDEDSTYAHMAGMTLKQISNYLIRTASVKYRGVLPRRVNYVCDEFPNFPMKDMDRALSAHLSRGIRYYLACQSKKQLMSTYPKEADTILANCENIYFLSSPEEDLLEELSQRAGTTCQTMDGQPKRLVPKEALRHLNKNQRGTEMYIIAGKDLFFSTLPDISQYQFARANEAPVLVRHSFPPAEVFTPEQMLHEILKLQNSYAEYHSSIESRISKKKVTEALQFEKMFGGIKYGRQQN